MTHQEKTSEHSPTSQIGTLEVGLFSASALGGQSVGEQADKPLAIESKEQALAEAEANSPDKPKADKLREALEIIDRFSVGEKPTELSEHDWIVKEARRLEEMLKPLLVFHWKISEHQLIRMCEEIVFSFVKGPEYYEDGRVNLGATEIKELRRAAQATQEKVDQRRGWAGVVFDCAAAPDDQLEEHVARNLGRQATEQDVAFLVDAAEEDRARASRFQEVARMHEKSLRSLRAKRLRAETKEKQLAEIAAEELAVRTNQDEADRFAKAAMLKYEVVEKLELRNDAKAA